MAIKYTWEIKGLTPDDANRIFKEEVMALSLNSRYQPMSRLTTMDGTLMVRRKTNAHSADFAMLFHSANQSVSSLKLIAEKSEKSTPTTRTVFTFIDATISKINYHSHDGPADSEYIFFDYTSISYKAESA